MSPIRMNKPVRDQAKTLSIMYNSISIEHKLMIPFPMSQIFRKKRRPISKSCNRDKTSNNYNNNSHQNLLHISIRQST